MDENQAYIVEYACDNNGNHQANVSECTESRTKEFNAAELAVSFIKECSYVYNLDNLRVIMPEFAPEIQDKITELDTNS